MYFQCQCKPKDKGGRCYWRMRPAMNILDHGWKHRAKEWKCGLDSDVTDGQSLADDTKLTEDFQAPPTNVELTESSRNRIPPGLKCDQKNAPDRIINGLGMFSRFSLVNDFNYSDWLKLIHYFRG